MLENHLGDTEFPVRWRWRYGNQYLADQPSHRVTVWVAFSGVVAAVVAVIGLVVVITTAGRDHFSMWMVTLPLAAAWWAFVGVRRLFRAVVAAQPLREQRRYRGLTGDRRVTERQQQLLALAASSDHLGGFWNSSLAYRPAEVALLEPLRSGSGTEFVTLPEPVPVEVMRAALTGPDEHSPEDYTSRREGLFAEHSASWALLSALTGPDAAETAGRLSRLLSCSPDDILDAIRPKGGKEPPLLWAFDVRRAIDVTREYYMAGLLSEDEAWAEIEKIASVAFERFGSWADYWDNLRLAVAFTENDLGAVRLFDKTRGEFFASAWPGARVEFPATHGVRLFASVEGMRPAPE